MPLRPKKTAVCLSLCVVASLLACSPLAAAAESDVFRIRTVVVDAGHGGRDPGAISGPMREKDVTLDVAVKFGRKIQEAYPDVKVVFTRDRDVYIPLDERSAIANRNKADLFVSVHVNSVKDAPGVHGTESYIMGTDKSNSNMEVCKAENSVILLEDDYSTKYAGYDPDAPDSFIFFNLMQSAQFEQSISAASCFEAAMQKGPIGHSRGIRQAPLLVLWKTTMPSVLVEIGFISSGLDRAALSDGAMRERVAECLFRGFADYKREYERQNADDRSPGAAVPSAPAAKPSPAPSDGAWAIQVFALKEKLPAKDSRLKDGNIRCVKIDGMYKYIYGSYASRAEAASALASLKKKYNGAFIVRLPSDTGTAKK